jgi:ankyrin repeat protein
MSDRKLPARPNLEQYKNQAKDLAKSFPLGAPDAVARVKRHHPRFHKLTEPEIRKAKLTRTDAQLVIAREHGFESWPKFASHIEMLHMIRSVASLKDPVAAFIEVACVPRHADHGSGTLEHAEMLLSQYPQVAESTIHTAAILGDETVVRDFLSRDPKNATATGGPYGWDALTHLCFSRYLRLDKTRSQGFVGSARALLDAGARANTGWSEMIDYPTPRPILERIIYGAACIARQPELTRLLLERGSDPNDEETPYHAPEGYDNTIVKILLASGKLNSGSLSSMLLRKTDWHDEEGIRLVLEAGADPNFVTKWGDNALHHALRRDNSLKIIELLLNRTADPALKNASDGTSATVMAVRRGRGDVLALLEQRNVNLDFGGIDQVVAACARGDRESIRRLVEGEPRLAQELGECGGTPLAEFAGNGNLEGVRCLLDLGVNVSDTYKKGDAYFDLTPESMALHVAAWRAQHSVVKELIKRGAPVNALDGKGRTALALAVKACVDSYWTDRRSPDSVEALLNAGASATGIKVPTGYAEVDELLRKQKDSRE